METCKKSLLLLMLMQVYSQALADETLSTASGQDAQKRQSRLDYLSGSFFARRDKISPLEPPASLATPANATEFKSVPAGSVPGSGLHWVPTEQRPTVEYRFSNNGSMRMHLNRHGAEATANWHF